MSLLSERPITVRMKREDGVLEVALHTRGGPREHTQYRSAHDCGHQWTADCAFRARPPLRHCFLPRQIHRRWALVARDETLPEIARELVVSRPGARLDRSEEHTSELQSHVNLVCRLLLEKKKKKKTI